MILELTEHQTRLAIVAFEQLAFKRCSQATEFQQRSLVNEADDLLSIASKLRKSLGWPEIDDAINQGSVRKLNL